MTIARRLLRWTQLRLAAKIRVSPATISHFEVGRRRPSTPIISAIQRTLEAAGIEFVEGEPGVKLRNAKA
jgi:transcriptional regulator with XRE-family HTH domain